MEYTEQERQQEIISRKGYAFKDLARTFIQALGETGPVASGKLIHYTADMICSGGLQLWEKLCWDYAYDHIGIGSPRIFVFIYKKFRELNELSFKMSFDRFCRDTDIQQKLAETVIILQWAPKKSKPKIPNVQQETHENEEWLKGVLRTTDKLAVRKVWSHSSDMIQLLHGSNEMVYAITESATERALFWARWIMEEDNIIKKKFGSGLSTADRGPPHVNPKQKTSAGYYIIQVLAEVYKEFAEKGMVRMHEEFQGLLDIYRSADNKISAKQRMDTIAVMIQILTDVPKWKVPAAPSLVPDQVAMQRVLQQTDYFFKEILILPLPSKPLPARVGSLQKKKVKNPSKQTQIENQLALTDKLLMDFYNK